MCKRPGSPGRFFQKCVQPGGPTLRSRWRPLDALLQWSCFNRLFRFDDLLQRSLVHQLEHGDVGQSIEDVLGDRQDSFREIAVDAKFARS
jgi:hypothetical protein